MPAGDALGKAQLATLRSGTRLLPQGAAKDACRRYALDLAPEHCGKLDRRMRAHPAHSLLTHPFEVGLMLRASREGREL